MPSNPPKAQLTFRVGIVGHRPHRLNRADIPSLTVRLGEALAGVKKSVEEFLETHPGLFAEGPPCFRAVSPLAEGVDRYFARQALRLGYELCCPLPFHKEELEQDFRPGKTEEPDMDSVADFNHILSEAKTKTDLVLFELDGERRDEAEAYAAAGRVVLNQSDLLVVVWDGGGNNPHGGTYATLQEALAYHVPVLWMDARTPHALCFLLKESDLPNPGRDRCVPGIRKSASGSPLSIELKQIVDRILQPPKSIGPSGGPHSPTQDLRTTFFNETKPVWNVFFVWKMFRDFFGSFHLRCQPLRVPDFEASVAKDWPKDAPGVAGWVNSRLVTHYAWADKLADHYADAYRSSFVLCYALGTLAVMLALTPVLLGLNHIHASPVVRFCAVFELLAVISILGLVWRGKARRWHDRWMEYRLVAEMVRQLRFLLPLGGGRPFPRQSQHLGNYGNPAESWMYWHLRAIDRAVGLPGTIVNANSLKDCLRYMTNVVENQSEFHRATAVRCERIEHRLHRVGFGLFVLVLVLIFAHLTGLAFASDTTLEHAKGLSWDGWTFFCAFLPAVGAALAAISNQGEFGRIARRSRAMAEQLDQMHQELQRLLNLDAIHSSETTHLAVQVAQTMVDEVLDWRVVFLDRPLVTPA